VHPAARINPATRALLPPIAPKAPKAPP